MQRIVRDDERMNVDPDASVDVPNRELITTLALIRAAVATLDVRPDFALQLAEHLREEQADSAALLPEVGSVTDVEGLRLHLHRLHARLVEVLGTPSPTLPPPPVTIPERVGALTVTRPSRSAAVIDDDLASAFVWWDDIAKRDLDAYVAILEAASDERPLQRHFALHPLLLVQHLHGGHGRWVLPQKRLGAEYVPDFAIAQRSSSGTEWQFVELQSPRARLFVPSSGRQSQQLDEGLRQVSEWRRWLAANRDYARRPRSEQGLGLRAVTADDPGLLLIGREGQLTDDDRERRRQLAHQHNVQIRTYDWITREAHARLDDLHRSGLRT